MSMTVCRVAGGGNSRDSINEVSVVNPSGEVARGVCSSSLFTIMTHADAGIHRALGWMRLLHFTESLEHIVRLNRAAELRTEEEIR